MSASFPINAVRTDDGHVIGHIVQVWSEQGYQGSFYQQRKRVSPPDACVNFGINARHVVEPECPDSALPIAGPAANRPHWRGELPGVCPSCYRVSGLEER